MRRLVISLALCLLPLAGVSGADPGHARATSAGVRYYLALGDSLAAGTQPGRLFTSEGYADQLFQLRRPRSRSLRLVRLACPGETTTAFRRGGRCPYPRGSQLAQATAFLRANRGRTAFVTIDIGANDYLRCEQRSARCALGALDRVRRNLPPILRALRKAAGPGVPIVGMEYYAPLVARWTNGLTGQLEARAHVAYVVSGNKLLRSLYRRGGARVARVQSAFAARDFSTLETVPAYGTVPRNVARVCRWTWMCSRGDIHPNAEGYGVIARAFAAALE